MTKVSIKRTASKSNRGYILLEAKVGIFRNTVKKSAYCHVLKEEFVQAQLEKEVKDLYLNVLEKQAIHKGQIMKKTKYAFLIIIFILTMTAFADSREGGFIVGPGLPPKGWYNRKSTAIDIEEERKKDGVKILDVPRYLWTYGCSPTAAGMIIAYHDRNGYPDLLEGIAPYSNDIYGTPEAGSGTMGFCPWIASTEHVKDFFIETGSKLDPFYDSSSATKNWEPHCKPGEGDCLADLMGTSQWNIYNGEYQVAMYDGGSRFEHTSSHSKIKNSFGDSDWGIKEFFRKKNYIIESDTLPKESITGVKFTFNDFCNEIDLNRPVLVHLQGHSVVGIGYNKPDGKIYLNDTWDYSVHAMEWEGYYGDSSWRIIRDITYIRPKESEKDRSLSAIIFSVNDTTMGKVYQRGVDSVYVTGSQTIKAAANEGYVFTSWTSSTGNCIIADSNSTETTITVNGEDTITANFAKDKPKYTVTFTVNGNGSISGNSTQIIYEGENCEIVAAVPGTANVFTGWTGDYTGTDNPLTVTNVTQNMTITANFEERYHSVKFSTSDGGGVSGEREQSVGHKSSTQAVTAISDEFYKFTGWTGDYTGTDNPLTISSVQNSMSIKANFVIDDSVLDISYLDNAKINIRNAGRSTITLKATIEGNSIELTNGLYINYGSNRYHLEQKNWQKGKYKDLHITATWKKGKFSAKLKNLTLQFINKDSSFVDIVIAPKLYRIPLEHCRESVSCKTKNQTGTVKIANLSCRYNSKKDFSTLNMKGSVLVLPEGTEKVTFKTTGYSTEFTIDSAKSNDKKAFFIGSNKKCKMTYNKDYYEFTIRLTDSGKIINVAKEDTVTFECGGNSYSCNVTLETKQFLKK